MASSASSFVWYYILDIYVTIKVLSYMRGHKWETEMVLVQDLFWVPLRQF